jgi:glycosyltransferase involved in cell wall biosynthesis
MDLGHHARGSGADVPAGRGADAFTDSALHRSGAGFGASTAGYFESVVTRDERSLGIDGRSMTDTSQPEVTVVMPTHNRAQLMQTTLRSVLRQRDVDLRVIVVDDGSSDETPEVLGAISDRRVRWHRNERSNGVSIARNTGLAMVDTPWVAFTDDDDLWAPDKLASQLQSLRSDPRARWSCVGSVMVDEQLRIFRHEPPPETTDLDDHLLRNNCIPGGGSGVLASTQLVRDVGGFDPAYSNLADWDLWVRLAFAAPATSLARPLMAYRVHATGMAHGVRRTEEELSAIIEKYADERTRRGLSISWPTWWRYLARLHLRRGDVRAAAGNYFRAARKGHYTRYAVGVMCLFVPNMSAWADRRGRLRVPRKWAKEADAWLDGERSEQTALPLVGVN